MSLIANILLLSLTIHDAALQSDQDTSTQSVKVTKEKNPGDLSYDAIYKLQQRLVAYMPSEPRTIDLSNRLSFVELAGQEKDDYAPPNWGVAIVGSSVDYVVPMIRGGYFVLLDMPEARQEKAKVLFNTKTKKNFIKTAWILRHYDNSLSYKDFARSFDEVKQIQEKIRWYELLNFRDEKYSTFDSLKACFLDSGGKILLDDKPTNTIERGRCLSLPFDKEQAKANPTIKFVGSLEILTLANTNE